MLLGEANENNNRLGGACTRGSVSRRGSILLETMRVAIIGGGIVGLATAHQLLERHPSVKVILLEKENGPGRHQTGHNSGVLHCGLYYKPGSTKARLAVEGLRRMTAFCAAAWRALRAVRQNRCGDGRRRRFRGCMR